MSACVVKGHCRQAHLRESHSSDHQDLADLALSETQRTVLDDIRQFLAIFDEVQQLLSSDQTPTLSLVIPVYEQLIGMLKNATSSLPNIAHAIEASIGKIQEYMDKAIELSDDLYRIQLHGRNRRNAAYSHAQAPPKATQREASLEVMDWEPSKVNQTRERRDGTRRPPPTCYNYGELGHIARKCRGAAQVKRARVALSSKEREVKKESEDLSDSSSGKEEL